MNKARRKKISDLVQRLVRLKNDYNYEELNKCIAILSDIKNEEEEIFDNMPEGLQYSTRGVDSESAIDSMNEALEQLEEINAIETYIEEAIGYLGEIY